MPAPGFGYSAGDFVATISLIVKVIAAFKDSGAASEEYLQLVSQLETLLNLMQQLDSIQASSRNTAHVDAIKVVLANFQGPLQQFLDKTNRRYGSSLDPAQIQLGGARARLAAVGRRVQWAAFMEDDIAKLRGMV